MHNSPQTWSHRAIAGLALAGFASGTLSVISSEPLSNIPQLQELRLMLYIPGAIFGVMVSAYFAIFLRVRSWRRLLLLIAASIASYFLAVLLSTWVVFSLRRFESLSRNSSWYGAMFLGGMVGAFVILIAAQLLLSMRRKWKAVLTAALLWSLAGGGLGAAGWSLGGSVGKFFWVALHAVGLTVTDTNLQAAVGNRTINAFSLFLVWQTGMAPVLGWLISKSSAHRPECHSATLSG